MIARVVHLPSALRGFGGEIMGSLPAWVLFAGANGTDAESGWNWVDVVHWVLIAAGVLVGLFVLIVLIGSLLARRHVVSRSLTTARSVEDVWQIITDYPAVTSWHKGVLSVERLPDRNGRAVWRETYKGNYGIQLEDAEVVPPHRLVRRIVDEHGPFSGWWEFDVSPVEGGGCRLRITERGEIPNPFFRFMGRLLMNPAMYLVLYLKALAGKLGGHCFLEETAGKVERI
jgi:uncharacterized protein YndB with AHSA1/START domain